MNRSLPFYFLHFLFLTLACSKTATSQKVASSTNNNNSVSTKVSNKTADKKLNYELQKHIEQIAASAKGRVGVAAVNLETGESVALNSGEKFQRQSVYKFPIAMETSSQVKDAVVAPKTETSGSQNGITAATNDIGLIMLPNGKCFAVDVFISDSAADEATREAVIAKIAKAAWDEWTK